MTNVKILHENYLSSKSMTDKKFFSPI